MKAKRWRFTVPCILPVGLDDICPGSVHCHGYDDPGDRESPPEGERLADPCDTCGAGEWTADEIDALYDGGDDDGGPYGGDGPDD